MYGLDPKQFKDLIVKPTLEAIGMNEPAAIDLVAGTCMKESLLTFVKQLPNGPALGVAQMETATHDDIWGTYLDYRPQLVASLKAACLLQYRPSANAMVFNFAYAVAMCRICYFRVSEVLPSQQPLKLYEYYKKYYNTKLGKSTLENSLKHFEFAVSLK